AKKMRVLTRTGLSLFLVIVAALCLGWAIRSPAAESPQAVARPQYEYPTGSRFMRCSRAFAGQNGTQAAKRGGGGPTRSGQRYCASALRHRAASPSSAVIPRSERREIS